MERVDAAPTPFAEASREVAEQLATSNQPGDPRAWAAIYLAVEAWRQLADDTGAWDYFGLEVLDVRARHYYDQHVEVLVGAACSDLDTRAAVCEMVTQLAGHHARIAASETLQLVDRLSHDATARQLQRAVAALL